MPRWRYPPGAADSLQGTSEALSHFIFPRSTEYYCSAGDLFRRLGNSGDLIIRRSGDQFANTGLSSSKVPQVLALKILGLISCSWGHDPWYGSARLLLKKPKPEMVESCIPCGVDGDLARCPHSFFSATRCLRGRAVELMQIQLSYPA